MSHQQEILELQKLLETCTNPAKENAIRRKIRELMEEDKKKPTANPE